MAEACAGLMLAPGGRGGDDEEEANKGAGEGDCTSRRRHLEASALLHKLTTLLRLYAITEPFSTRSILYSSSCGCS